MAHRILIPTPLRAYTAQQDVVEAEGRTVGDVLAALTSQYGDLRRHLYSDDGKLRSFVNVYVNDDDIRYRERERTELSPGDVISIVPSVAGGAPATAQEALPELSNDEVAALQPAFDHARGRRRRPAQAEGRARAVRRRGRPRFAGGPLPRRGRRRHAGDRRFRRRRRQQPAASDPAQHAGHRPVEAAVRPRSPEGAQSGCERADARDRADLRERARDLQGLRRDRRRRGQLPDALSRQRRVRVPAASRTPTAASSGSRDRRRCSRPSAAPAIAASIPSRRLRGWSPVARRAACSACCPASSARSRRPRRSS